MFHFIAYTKVPEQGSRMVGGGLLEVNGRVIWGRGEGGGVYWLDNNDKWNSVPGAEDGATLAVCDKKLVAIGGRRDGVFSSKVMVYTEGKWNSMSDMLLGCSVSCVVGDGVGGLVVMGGQSDGYRLLSNVQVFDGETQTWRIGPALPQPCFGMSAVVHKGLVFLMGGFGMDRAVWCANLNDLIAANSEGKQGVWRKLPDAPCTRSSVCVVDGVLLALGGSNDSESKLNNAGTSAIYAFDPTDQKWQRVGEMPFECSSVNTLLLSEERLLVIDGRSLRVLVVTVKGLATVFPNASNFMTADDRVLHEKQSVTNYLILGEGNADLKQLLEKDPSKKYVITEMASNPVLATSPACALPGMSGQVEDDRFKHDQPSKFVTGGPITGGQSLMADVTKKMFQFETCTKVPERGGARGLWGCGLLEVEGKIVWGRGGGGVYWLDVKGKWNSMVDGVEKGSRLAVYEGKLVAIGGAKNRVRSKKVMLWRNSKWTPMPDMLTGCELCSVVSVGFGGLVVMGGEGDGDQLLNSVQVFDGKTLTWHIGPPLPQPCSSISAVVHGDLVFMMGGMGMERSIWCANLSNLIAASSSTNEQQSPWRKLPDVPYYRSSVCVVEGVLLAVGGLQEEYGSKDTTAIYAFNPTDQKWQHVGDMPFQCSYVDTLMSGGRLFVVDGARQRVVSAIVEGLATLFPPAWNPATADNRKLYDEAMSKGYVETSVTKCLILGAAGVGKTHLKHLLLKKDPPKQRISTGLADNPIRAISFTLAGIGAHAEDDWFVVEDDHALMSVIGGTIKAGISMAPSLADVVSTLPKMAIDTSNVSNDSTVISAPVALDTILDPLQPEQSKTVDIEDEMIEHINQSSDNKKLFNVKWIQFIDSGGQLQYHDILPLFIQDPAVTIVVLKLSEELTHHPTIEYYGADGKPLGKPYRSALSHEQILHYCLGALRSQNTHPLIITVGTHRDTESECTESLKEKNQRLQSLLDPTCFHVLYKGEGMKEIIFAVNGYTPEYEDRHVAQVLRKEIVSESLEEFMKMPIAWFGLEVVLQRTSHDGVLSLIECQIAAKRFYIEGDAFFAALHHLVNYNVFLYYPEVLPQTVFCDPQVVLSKMTELVQYHYKLRDNPDEGVAVRGDLVMFRDHGLVSMELLRKFPMYYIEGLFTPHDLVKLLVNRCAVAIVGDGHYLMPALLPHLESTHMSKYRQQSTSLIIKFTHGYIPTGLFCCLVAHLLSSSWKVCMDREQPLCLHRNCIRFEQRGTPEIMTLIDMFSYIEVHVNIASIHISEAASEVHKVCREIRSQVYNGIKNACSVLKYHDVQLEDAFMCVGTHCSSHPPHVAVVTARGPTYKWRCTKIGDQLGDLSMDQLMWLSEFSVSKNAVHPSISTTTMPTIRHLMSISAGGINIIQSIGTRYPTLGIFLLEDDNGLLVDALTLEHHRNAEEITRAIFQRWITGTGRKPTTWKTLIEVLRQSQLAIQADSIEAACFSQ